MDWVQALEILGVEEPVEPRALKRAYHQRLRTTKPDEDPEGFKRLREAYELLQSPDYRNVISFPEHSEVDAIAAELAEGVPPAEVAQSWLESQVDALGSGPETAMDRIELLDALLHERPDDEAMWTRLFHELMAFELTPAVDAALDDLEVRHPKLAWSLRLAHRPRTTTTWALRNPPVGVTTAERIAALFVLIDVHRWSGETGAIARQLVRTRTAEELAEQLDALVRLALRLGLAGFVADAQLLLCDVERKCPAAMAAEQPLAVEWARAESVAKPLLRQLAGAMLVGDEDLVDVEASGSAEAIVALRSQAAGLYRRFERQLEGAGRAEVGPPAEGLENRGARYPDVHGELGDVRAAKIAFLVVIVVVLLGSYCRG